MTPVMQSKLYAADAIHSGNCFAACLASLLDLPLWMVPPFEDMFWRSDWNARVDEWLLRLFRLRRVRTEGEIVDTLPADGYVPAEYYIASGLSARGVRHSVIYRAGHLAHDPHPSGAGILADEWCWHLERVR